MTVPAVGYIRVSTREQVRTGLSLISQERKLRAYARFSGFRLVEIVSEDGVSGAIPFRDRPGGRKVVSLIEDAKVRAVIIAKLDRGFRNVADCLTMVEDWDQRGISLHIVDLGGNTVNSKSAAGKFMLTVLAAAAEMERNVMAERIMTGIHERLSNGLHMGEAPYGWRYETDPETGKAVRTHLIWDASEQDVIEQIRILRHLRPRKRLGFQRIASILNRREIKTRKGRPWQAQTVFDIYKNNRRRPKSIESATEEANRLHCQAMERRLKLKKIK